jgi:hypothetical protein
LSTSLTIEISKPVHCNSSLNGQRQTLFDHKTFDLYSQTDLNLSVTSNSSHKITYGTEYVVSLNLNKTNIQNQTLNFNHKTSNFFFLGTI